MTPEERREKERVLLAMREMERRRKNAPLIYWQPHAGQQLAIKLVKTHRVTIIHPGNRWGKTHLAAAMVLAYLYGYCPWEVPNLQLTPEGDYPPREHVPPEYWITRGDGLPLMLPAKHLAVTGLPARQGILSTLWPKIEAFIPPAIRRNSNFRVLRGAQGVPLVVHFPPECSTHGAELHFASGEQDPMAYEGQSFTSASIDEPPKRVLWTPLWRGLTDHYAPVWFTMTPWGPNAPWVHETFIQKGDDLGISIAVHGGSIHENPHVSDDAKQEFLAGGGFTEEELDAREHGSWSFQTHMAFPQFNRSVHIIPKETPLPPGALVGMACDPAHRRPFMFVWLAFLPGGEVWIIDEWPEDDHSKMRTSPYTVPDYVRVIREKEQGRQIIFRCLDPRFGQAAPRIKGERHTSIQDDFMDQDMYFDCCFDGTEREEIGIEKIRQLLSWDNRKPLDVWNRPKLRVMSHCINSINALAYSVFAPNRDPDKLDEKTTEKYKDARDCIRYGLLYPWSPPAPEDFGYISQKDLEEFNDDQGWQW